MVDKILSFMRHFDSLEAKFWLSLLVKYKCKLLVHVITLLIFPSVGAMKYTVSTLGNFWSILHICTMFSERISCWSKISNSLVVVESRTRHFQQEIDSRIEMIYKLNKNTFSCVFSQHVWALCGQTFHFLILKKLCHFIYISFIY